MSNDDFSSTINNLKNIINNSSDNTTNTTNTSNSSNLNITPEMISNLTHMLNNNNSDNSSNNDQNNQTYENNTNSSDNPFSNIDIETVLKLKNIITSLNQTDDNNSKLLYSLKPYLNENRQKKVDQYVKIFKFTKLSSLLKNDTGDKK